MLTQILEQNPADTFARYGLAMEFVAQKRIPEGLAEFEKIIEANPDYVPAYQMSLRLNGCITALLLRTGPAISMLWRRWKVSGKS